jgi:hypothetical protein
MMRDAVVHRVEIRLERKKLSFRCAIDLVLAVDLRQPTYQPKVDCLAKWDLTRFKYRIQECK